MCDVPRGDSADAREAEKQSLLMLGILNLLLPGIGTIVYGCMHNHDLVCRGILQLLLCPWGWCYGIMMILASTNDEESKDGEQV